MLAFSFSVVSLMLIFLMQLTYIVWKQFKKKKHCHILEKCWLAHVSVCFFDCFICLLLVPDVALDREVEGDLLVGDMGQGMPFRPGTFDGCIRLEEQHPLMWEKIARFFFFFFWHFISSSSCSISALQWLCNADKRTHSPPKRLYTFFSTLYSSLVRLYLS